MDVCDKLKVHYNKSDTTIDIENNLIMKIIKDSLENISEEERIQLAKELGLKNSTNLTNEILLASFQAIFKLGGFQSYQLTVIVANAVLQALIGRGLSIAANATLTKTMAILTGPIGWTITALWTAITIAGPAYRVTIPAVIEIAALRKKYNYMMKQESWIKKLLRKLLTLKKYPLLGNIECSEKLRNLTQTS